MSEPLFAYVGPETILPASSVLAAIGGALLLFGGSVKRCAGRFLQLFVRRSS